MRLLNNFLELIFFLSDYKLVQSIKGKMVQMKKCVKLWFESCLLWGICVGSAEAFVKVIDGDSLVVDNKEIRLSGIDAPEYKQTCFNAKNKEYPCGKLATQFLKKLAGDDTKCKFVVKDKYKRYVSVCYSHGVNINEKMVEEGWAVAYKRYTQEYNDAEEQAEKRKKGIWQGRFLKPELYRILNKK